MGLVWWARFNACMEIMKKTIISFIFAVVGVLSASAQLQFFALDDVKQVSPSQFVVRSGAQSLKVYADVYDSIRAIGAQNCLMVVYKDAKQQTITIAPKARIKYMRLAVDSVGIGANDASLVFMAGSASPYVSPNKDWRTVRPGQKVEGAVVDGFTKIIARKWHTVPRELPVTTEIPISPAPTTPVLVMNEDNRIMAATTTRTANANVNASANVNANANANADVTDELVTDFPVGQANAEAVTTPAPPAKKKVTLIRTSK